MTDPREPFETDTPVEGLTATDLDDARLDERGSAGLEILDLSYLLRLSDEDATAVGQAVDFLTPRFAKVFETDAPAYLSQMHAALTALGEGLKRTRTPARS